MALAVGTKLGPYLIEELLGIGGMGEVYRALDTRLRRSVAIKVLGGGLAGDPHFQQRFEREARAVAALEHPHICPLYDIGEHAGAGFIVMQYLDGQSLAARLRSGALPLDDVLRCGAQLARALHAAHRAGVIHRDLKPANVMLTKSGVKLLDFGLARVAAGADASTSHSEATVAAPITEDHALIGTVPYMAPEQLEGREADVRTDVFALGAVLYELTTGRRPFAGGSHAAVSAAILASDPPPMSTLRPEVPPALERIVRKCLARDPDARWQSANDLADALSWIGDVTTGSVGLQGAARSPWRTRSAWLGVAGAALAAAAIVWMLRPAASTVPEIARFTVQLPPGVRIHGAEPPALALSPDGRHLVYAGVREGERQLFVRALEAYESLPLAGTAGGSSPFFSPTAVGSHFRWAAASAEYRQPGERRKRS